MKSLQELYVKELKDLYDAENQIIKALPKMAKAASSPELQSAFRKHLEQTRGQVGRLDRIFEMLDSKSRRKKCKGIEGIIEEGKELLNKKDVDHDVLDAGLLAAAQKVEHYEIAGYGTARTYAQMLGYDEAAQLLQQTLDEEKETDRKLTEIAERGVNVKASELEGYDIEAEGEEEYEEYAESEDEEEFDEEFDEDEEHDKEKYKDR